MRGISNTLQKNNFAKIIAITLLLLPFYLLLYKNYIARVNAFGCFDECFNYGAGYFLLHGKTLYSQIFFNHQPSMAYISLLIQKLFSVTDIFQLLLRHRQIQFLYSIAWGIIIIRRFRWSGVFFIIPYELSKFYIFGDRFLAEAFIVYPMAYLLGSVWEKLKGIRLSSLDYLWCAFLAWFIIMSREPYVLYAIIAFSILIWKLKFPIQRWALVLFLSLLALCYTFIPFQAYWMSIYEISFKGVAGQENLHTHILGIGALEVFFYPIFIFFTGQFNAFKLLLLGYSTAFITNLFFILRQKGNVKKILLVLLLLGITNLRPVTPGTIFYAAFHMIPWFGMFLLLTGLFFTESQRKVKLLSYGFLGIIVVIYIFLARDLYWYKIDTQTEFFVNFGESYGLGETVHTLSSPQNTLFISGHDDLVLAYIEAQRNSSYPYSWFSYITPGIPTFIAAEKNMFINNPPDFYIGLGNDIISPFNRYVNIPNNGKPSKLYIKQSTYNKITDQQWESVKRFGYTKVPPSS